MKLPKALAPLADRIVCSDLPKFKKEKQIGLLFDGSTLNKNQRKTLLELFGDSQRGDFVNLVDWGDEDDDTSWGPKAFRDDAMPFMLWQPDELFDDTEVLLGKLKKNATKKTPALDKGSDGFSSYPQFQTLWFLHKDGSVTFAEVDGSIEPKKKSKVLVRDVAELKLRLATVDDVDVE